jgi:uncharacterized radical SAM protein YgiQ
MQRTTLLSPSIRTARTIRVMLRHGEHPERKRPLRHQGAPGSRAPGPAPPPRRGHSEFLPLTPAEVRARGWDEVDIVFVTGDAYVDHPSFANALLGRLLEDAGYRVALLAQPDWRSCEPWRVFGRPRLFFGISAGNMDSMINHYTANRKVRNDDAYSPGGEIGRRPDRATLAYCQRAREAYPGVPVIAGGVEASLRRLAHYDYWSDKVRRSILLDSKADLVVFGMGEKPILEIARRLAAGETVRELRDLRGVAYRLGASEPAPQGEDTVELPSYEDAASDPVAFCRLTRLAHQETNPYNARRLTQRHGHELVVVNPPGPPLTPAEMDHVYGLPYTRRPHPSYGRAKIPAFEVVRTSVQVMRGCFGGCTFCSITAHEGRIVQSRSPESVLEEIRRMAAEPGFSGVVSDIGGPTANMYRMRCTRPGVEARCRRLSCVHPTICRLLGADHAPLLGLMRAARRLPGVKQVFIASGIRMDLARLSPQYIRELAAHHTGGLLKVAPEHTDPEVLRLMKKPGREEFQEFARLFHAASREAGKTQHLVPYYIAGHPGSDLNAMIDLAVFLKRNGYRPDQVQDFIPSPFDVAAAMYHTGLDPFTLQPVPVAKGLHDRRVQKAILQFFKPENWFEVRRALDQAGRADLVGAGGDCLIPARPPQEAMIQRRARARRDWAEGPPPERGQGKPERRMAREPGAGYRPHRQTASRRPRTGPPR